jgi:hypothetical protein
MPRPPSFDPIDEFKFIVNYALAGCTPPYDLFVQLSQAPARRLLLLILAPDPVDIGQAMLGPQRHRRRLPARHGKKPKISRGVPDVSDIIGGRIRAVVNPHDALSFGPTRAAFRIWNKYEGIAFTAALVEGFGDIGFETLWGIMQIEPEHCLNLGRLGRHGETAFIAGGAGPEIWPISMPTLDFVRNFQSNSFGCSYFGGPFNVSMSATAYNGSGVNNVRVQIALGVVGGATKGFSSTAELGPGDSINLTCDADFDSGDNVEWGVRNRNDNPVILDRAILAYGQQEWPWPW